MFVLPHMETGTIPADICLEDEDTGGVILDAELYTLCAREE